MPRNVWRQGFLLLSLGAMPHGSVGLFSAYAAESFVSEPTAQTLRQADLERVNALMTAGRFAEAYSLLREEGGTQPSSAVLFLLGRCAYELGRYAQAIAHYRAILAIEPDSPRVRAELGKTYLADGQGAQARVEFEAVLASNPPEHVRGDIQNLMATAQHPKSWNARAALGYLYDNNVNVGPNTMSVQLFGIPFELTPASAPQSDHALRATVSGVVLNAMSANSAWQSDLSADSTDYSRLDAFDYLQLAALSGPKWRAGERLIFLPLMLEYTELGHSRYAESYGLSPQFERALNAILSLKGGFTLQHKTFATQPERSGTSWGALATLRRAGAASGDYAELSYRHVFEGARASFLQNRSNWLSLGYFAKWRSVFFYFEPTIGWIDYAEKEAVFDAARKDVRSFLTINLSKNYRKDTLSIAIGYTRIRNRSNISINEYDRALVTIQATRSF